MPLNLSGGRGRSRGRGVRTLPRRRAWASGFPESFSFNEGSQGSSLGTGTVTPEEPGALGPALPGRHVCWPCQVASVGGCLVWFGFGFVFLIGGQRLEARRFHIKGCFSGDFYGKGGFLAVRLQSHPDPRLTSEASLQPGALLLATVPTPPYCLTQAAASVECETPNLFQPWRFEGGQSGRT